MPSGPHSALLCNGGTQRISRCSAGCAGRRSGSPAAGGAGAAGGAQAAADTSPGWTHGPQSCSLRLRYGFLISSLPYGTDFQLMIASTAASQLFDDHQQSIPIAHVRVRLTFEKGLHKLDLSCRPLRRRNRRRSGRGTSRTVLRCCPRRSSGARLRKRLHLRLSSSAPLPRRPQPRHARRRRRRQPRTASRPRSSNSVWCVQRKHAADCSRD